MNGTPIVLVVDDQAPNRKLLVEMLGAHGYEAHPASSGRDALDQLPLLNPDLILLDVLMPELDGYAVCRTIRSDPRTATLPVVMVTALDPAEERVRGLEAGADDFLVKPVNTAELLARVRSLLRIKSFHDTVQTQAAELTELNAELERRVQTQLVELQRLTQLKRFFPPHLAERIVAGDEDDPLATRRREVSVVSLDLRGFNAFADTSEPEEVMGLLRRYHAEMGASIQVHDGSLEQFSCASMLVVFNDPMQVDDPAGSAVRMALDMQQRFAALVADSSRRGHDMSLSVGIAHGYATIGAIGYEGRTAYGVIGRVTNLATRLATQAGPGEILASAPVVAQVESFAQAEAVPGIDLSDFARPVAAFRIVDLKASAPAPVIDPRPLRIHTLGQFSLVRQREPVVFSRKAQKRPLDLLKALIGYGGTRVDIGTLITALWPEAEGSTAKFSFDSTLHRLRRLIEMDDVLVLSEGRLSLDGTRCWVDAWAFDQLVDTMERTLHDAARRATVDHARFVEELLRLYRGHFVENESQEPWAVAARDKFKAKFERAVTMLGLTLEQHGEWERCVTLYSRALELDNLAEGLHRRLMISYRELGEPAEALRVYRRCKDMLSIVLGLKPAPETEAVRASIG